MDTVYEKPLQFGPDPTEYRLLTTDHVSTRRQPPPVLSACPRVSQGEL